jgi:pectate lyase
MFSGFMAGAEARVLEVGSDKPYKLPSEAIKDAKDGDDIRISAGEYFDCANITANDLIIEGVGPNASAVITDKACGGKALLITAGNNITVRNLTLTRARVPDGNGAGIRAEGNKLTVENVKFLNNQNGLLGSIKGSTIIIRDSEFLQNGTCVNMSGCAHGIYAGGELDLLHIENSKFFETKEGHHIKSRALRTEVIGCDIRDGSEGTSSYLVEIPNGGTVIIRDSTLEKGPKAQNHSSAISIGAEGVTHPSREITIENITFKNDGNYNTVFVKNLTATEAVLKHNKISGPAKALDGDGSVQ